jgi:hypothetical protein
MPTKTEIEQIKKIGKEQIREFSQQQPYQGIYAYYYLGPHIEKRARCYGDLFSFIRDQNLDNYANIVMPLRFDRRLKYFDYDALFQQLNRLYGHYFKVGRYYSGYKYVRLVHVNPIKKPKPKSLWWGGLYSMFLLLRKINLHYYQNWNEYFAENKARKIKTWEDILYISEAEFGDDGYYIHDDLFKLCFKPDKVAAKAWIKNFLNMLNGVFGQGMVGNTSLLRMGPNIYNTSMINGLLNYWESAK